VPVQGENDQIDWETILPYERVRLVRLCTYLTGDREAAEDLTQETLYVAWRDLHRVYDRQGWDAWLSAIARNMCRRWSQTRRRERLDHAYHSGHRRDDLPVDCVEDVPTGAVDVEIELERAELATLLDRALALLSPDMRTVLVERYIHERSHGEIAQRLGISEGAVKMKVSRGKLALYRVLTTHLPQEAAAYGLAPPEPDVWRQTRIWCTTCGHSRLNGRFDPNQGLLDLHCPSCPAIRGSHNYVHSGPLRIFEGVTGYKAALTRLLGWNTAYWQDHGDRTVSCQGCGQPIPCHMGRYDVLWPSLLPLHFVRAQCHACAETVSSPLNGLLLGRRDGQRFWREHQRIRTLPELEVEVDGCAALVTRLESVTSAARIEAVCRRDTYEVMAVHVYGAAGR